MSDEESKRQDAAPRELAKTKRKSKAKRKGKTKRAARTRPVRPYPRVPLAKALEIPQKIKALNGGEPWTPADVAAAIGMGASTGDFFYVTAASRDFGLTTGTRDTAVIALEELGREIVYAPSPEVERAKKLEAFQRIDLFNKVLKHYKGANVPEMKYLGNTLQREFGLDPSFHEEFSRVFRENCKYLEITSGETTVLTADDTAPTTVLVGEPTKKSTIRAFVIMPFSEKSPERAKGFFSEVLSSLITAAGVEAGFKVETANRQGSDVIQSTIVNELLDADLVIADLTDHNPNVMFELGLRIAAEKPVALIKAAGTGRVFDVDNMMRVVEYRPNLWRSTIETDVPELTKHFKAAWENRSKDHSYMKILRRSGKTDAPKD